MLFSVVFYESEEDEVDEEMRKVKVVVDDEAVGAPFLTWLRLGREGG